MTSRQSFEVEGYRHGANPIPAASRIGNIVVTGGISGIDLGTGEMPETLDEQCANMFALMAKVVEAAGVRVEDVIKMTVFLRPGLQRDAVNREWVKYFPAPHSRPGRHTVINEHLAPKMLVQCEVMAVAGS
jgi:2-iminobutanoate/2-iminopropanoate deaminase